MAAKFGYSFEAPTPWVEMVGLARELDQRSNFDSLWIADSLVANGPPDEPKLEAWTSLAAIAQATTRLRLGLLVAGNPYRHPALTAKIVTTLDHISNGRVELGFGAGWPDPRRREPIGPQRPGRQPSGLIEAMRSFMDHEVTSRDS